jgi:DNA mismatch repair protein MutS
MCGVPFHSVDSYIARLINKGFKVAICEQVEDPALATGIVKREVIRVVTPGTVTDSSMLDEKKNNYLLSIYRNRLLFGLASVDITTGEFAATRITWGNTPGKLLDEIAKLAPSEIIANGEFFNDTGLLEQINKRFNIYISRFDDEYYKDDHASEKLKALFGNEN